MQHTSIFRDVELEAANDILRDRQPAEPTEPRPEPRPVDTDVITYSSDGVPMFLNVPSSSAVIDAHNRGLEAHRAAVERSAADIRQRNQDRGKAYVHAARMLASGQPDLTHGQQAQYDKLMKQLARQGRELLSR